MARYKLHIIIIVIHWLKIAEWIQNEVVLLKSKALALCKPDYLSNQLRLYAPVRRLRLSDRKNLLLL